MNQANAQSGHGFVATGAGPEGTGLPLNGPGFMSWQGAIGLPTARQNVRSMRRSTRASSQAALRTTAVKVSSVRVLWRLLRIASVALYFLTTVLWRRFWTNIFSERIAAKYQIGPEDVDARRQQYDAKRFRRLVERLGGVLIKVGQQLSQRTDLLPAAYCDELKDFLTDIGKQIRQEDVRAAIWRQIRRPLNEVFSNFCFEPVGRASVACVYQAFLKTGEEVAVKIRRPGLQKQFTADLKALALVIWLAEFLTIWRPHLTDNFRRELKASILEELDFRLEARYQELFRRYHKRRKKLHVTAPKVFFDWSGDEVIVTEFVRGRKVQEIADHMGDEEYLAELRCDGINPKTIAKRLVRSRYYSFHECPMFHGDPHPGNIIVQPNNRIVMIDFGACGVFSERDRNLMWQMNYYYSRDDVAGMVNMVLSIMEPVEPPSKTWDQFKKELLDAWWKGFYGIKSKHAEHWERTSFRLWLAFYQLIKKHQIAVPRDMVRMIRATLLYDTVAATLYPKINVFEEFERYSRGVARRARYRIQESAVRQLLCGPDDSAYLKLQQIADVGNGLLFRLQKWVDDPPFSFAAAANKIYSAVRAFVRMFVLAAIAALMTAIAGLLLYASSNNGLNYPWKGPFLLLQPSKWNASVGLQIICLIYVAVLVLLFLIYGRRVYLRFGDKDDDDKSIR